MSKSTPHLIVLIPLLLWVMWFGTHGSIIDSLWFDEFWSLYNAGGVTYDGIPRETPLDLKSTWFQIRDVDPIHPPGYAFALAIWSRFTGWTPFSGRMMSVLLGIVAIATLYRTGRDLFNAKIGTVAAYLFGTSAFFAHYYHEMRMYTLLVLLVSLALWSYWRLLHRSQPIFAGIVFVISLAGLVYTQYLSLFIAIAIGIYHLIFAPKNHRWLIVAALAIIAGLLYIPWLQTALNMFTSVTGGPSRAGVFSNSKILSSALAIFSNSLITSPRTLIFSFIPLFTLLINSALIPSEHRRSQTFILIVFITTATLMLLINAQTGMFIHIRYLLVMFPPLMLLLALGLQSLISVIICRDRAMPCPPYTANLLIGVTIALWIISGMIHYPQFEATYNRDAQWTLPWDAIVTALQDQTTENDLIVVQAAGNRQWWDYAQIATFYTHDLPASVTLTPLRPYQSEAEFTEQWRTEQLNGETRIFSVYDKTQPANTLPLLENALTDDYTLCNVLIDSQQIHIDVYVRADIPCESRN